MATLGTNAYQISDRKKPDLALKVLEKVGGYEGLLKKPNAEVGEEDRESCNKMIAEYYVLRTAVVCFINCMPLRSSLLTSW